MENQNPQDKTEIKASSQATINLVRQPTYFDKEFDIRVKLTLANLAHSGSKPHYHFCTQYGMNFCTRN